MFRFICSLQKYVICIALGVHSFASVFAQTMERKYSVSSARDLSGQQELRSLKERDLAVVRFSAVNPLGQIQPAKYHFYLQAGLHGNENLTTEFAFWLIKRLRLGQSELNRLPASEVAFDIVPLANPDGARERSRYNARGVNLNRNFSYFWGHSKEKPGGSSFSEPETQAIRYLFANNRYTAAVDIHGYVNWLVAPSKPTKDTPPERVDQYKRWLAILTKSASVFSSNYEIKTAMGLGDGGAFEDWAFWEAKVPSFCFEFASAFRYEDQISASGFISKRDHFLNYESLIYEVFNETINDQKSRNTDLAQSFAR